MKKLVASLMLAVVAAAVLGGCANSPKQETEKPKELQELSIGLMPSLDAVPFIIAQEKGFFTQEGLNVKLKTFSSPLDRESALQSGMIDGSISDMQGVGFDKAGGFDIVITSASVGNYKLVANKASGINRLSDLQGKDVAVSKNTAIEYVADKMLADGGMSSDSINKVVIPQIPVRLEMLQNGKLEAAVLPEPVASVAIKNGAKVIRDTQQMNRNPSVVVFTRQAVTGKEKEIQALYRAYNKAVEYIAAHPQEEYMDILIEQGGFPEAIKGILTLPAYPKAAAPRPEEIQDVLDWMSAKKMLTAQYGYRDLVDDRFVR